MSSEQQHATAKGADPDKDVQLFLQEIRVLLPGTQVLVAFLMTVPFQSRYEKVPDVERFVFLATFLAATLALVCFVSPSVYHRLSSPLHEKRKFVAWGSRIVKAGFFPMAAAFALSTQLVTSMVVGSGWACLAALVVAALLVVLWGVSPRRRAHERVTTR